MSESFKQQGVPGEVPGVIREDSPRPLLGRPDNAVPPTGLPSLGVDGPAFNINVPSTEPVNDLPLDAGSGHKGLHCPLPATESPNQRLSLGSAKPHFTRFVSLCGSYVSDWIVGNGFEFHQIAGEDREGSPVSDFGGTATTEPLQEQRDVPLGKPFGAVPLPLGDKPSHLTFVLRPSIPLPKNCVQVYMIERGNELREPIGFDGYIKIGQRGSLQYDQFERLPLETPPQGAYHVLDRQGSPIVGGSEGMRSAPLVGEVEPSLVDRSAFATEGHLDTRDAPVDAPVSRARIYGWGVTLYPGRESNPHDPSGPRNFEDDCSPLNRNDLDAPHSEDGCNGEYRTSTAEMPEVPQ